MTEPSTRPRFSGHLVTAVLVCHDGAQWLPEVLDALADQTRQPERFVAVDTASTDGSADLIRSALGAETLIPAPATAGFGTAVQVGLDAFGATAVDPSYEPPVEWVWLLHDDCAPDPWALDELLARVDGSPSVWMVGPKVRAWDGARLLEAGLTLDATGHIDTGFDGVELDQGQRDDVDEVLAVGTAGALIRRDIWDRLHGLDAAWPTYAGDVDFGWRINAAGGRVVVATEAVVRHVRAQTIGRRPTAPRHGSPAVLRRRSGMQVVLANTSPWLVLPLLVRYAIGGLLRALGLLVIARMPDQAVIELRAVAMVFAQPMLVVSARRTRAKRKTPHHQLRALLPKASRRWRSSPFFLGRFTTGRARTIVRTTSAETGPTDDDSESMSVEPSVIGAFFRRPSTVLFLGMSLLALIAERNVMGSFLHGGRLLVSPDGDGALWSTYTAAWHPVSLGSTIPAPPYLAVLAALSTVLFAKAWLVIDVLVLGAVPLSALSAYTAARALTSAVRVRIWAAIAYSLLPAVTGAVAGGRLDVVVVAIVLPQLMRLAVAALRLESGSKGWRRTVGAGLLLSLACAFAPMMWVLTLVGLAAAIGFDRLSAEPTPVATPAAGDAAVADVESLVRRRVVVSAMVLVTPLLALLPWSWHVIAHPGLLVSGTGAPEFVTSHSASGFGLALLRAGGPAQPPFWIGIPIIGSALLGLNRQTRVAVARAGAALLVVGVIIAVVETRGAGVTTGLAASRHWPGLLLLVAGAGALLSALVAAVGARPALAQQSFSWRQPAAGGIVVLAIISMFVLAGGWMIRGAGKPLTDSNSHVLPLFTESELAIPTTPRALVLTSTGPRVSYALVRRPGGPQLGDADVEPAADSAAGKALAAAVRDLVAGRPGADNELVPFGVKFVVVPTPSVARLRSALGQGSTLIEQPAGGATEWQSTLPTGELTVLNAQAAKTALAGRVPTDRVAKVLNATPGSATVTLADASASRLLVLNEPASSHWHASLAGKPLSAKTAYGWAQAFVLPPGAGRLTVHYSDGSRHLWLVLELILVVAGLVSTVPVRRGDDVEVPA